MSNLSGFVKRLRDIMRNDAGINGDAQRIEQIAWMLFLKVYDAKEQDWEFDEENYTSIIPDACRWNNWAHDETGKPYVRTAIAKGLSPTRVLVRHVLRNSLIPVVTNVSLAVPFLFTGSILLESFFGIPGIGGIGLNAVYASDFATLRAVVLVSALLYQLANLLADLAYAWLDPQVRLAE